MSLRLPALIGLRPFQTAYCLLLSAFRLLTYFRQAALVAAEAALVVVEGRVEAFGQLDLDLAFGAARPEERGGDRADQQQRDEGERAGDDRLLAQAAVACDVALREHLDADEGEDDGEADLQVVELLGDAGQEEVHRA